MLGQCMVIGVINWSVTVSAPMTDFDVLVPNLEDSCPFSIPFLHQEPSLCQILSSRWTNPGLWFVCPWHCVSAKFMGYKCLFPLRVSDLLLRDDAILEREVFGARLECCKFLAILVASWNVTSQPREQSGDVKSLSHCRTALPRRVDALGFKCPSAVNCQTIFQRGHFTCDFCCIKMSNLSCSMTTFKLCLSSFRVRVKQ